MTDIQTIKIAHPELSGPEYMVINLTDFDAAQHTLFVEGEAADDSAKKKGKAKKVPTPNAALLTELRTEKPDEAGDLEDETTPD
jgi:hypothetical protein